MPTGPSPPVATLIFFPGITCGQFIPIVLIHTARIRVLGGRTSGRIIAGLGNFQLLIIRSYYILHENLRIFHFFGENYGHQCSSSSIKGAMPTINMRQMIMRLMYPHDPSMNMFSIKVIVGKVKIRGVFLRNLEKIQSFGASPFWAFRGLQILDGRYYQFWGEGFYGANLGLCVRHIVKVRRRPFRPQLCHFGKSQFLIRIVECENLIGIRLTRF